MHSYYERYEEDRDDGRFDGTAEDVLRDFVYNGPAICDECGKEFPIHRLDPTDLSPLCPQCTYVDWCDTCGTECHCSENSEE